MSKNLISRTKAAITHSFTKDIAHQPFIDGMVSGANEGVLIAPYMAAHGISSPYIKSPMETRRDTLKGYHCNENKSFMEKAQYNLGEAIGIVSTLPLSAPLILGGVFVGGARSLYIPKQALA